MNAIYDVVSSLSHKVARYFGKKLVGFRILSKQALQYIPN